MDSNRKKTPPSNKPVSPLLVPSLFVGIWGLLMLTGRTDLLSDPGTFWHVVVGEKILSSGQLVYVDEFSFTFSGTPWIAQQWLAECIMAVLHRAAGLTGLVIATATLIAGLFTWTAVRFIQRGVHWMPTLILVLYGVAATAGHLHARPHIATMLLLGVMFGWLCDFEAGRVSLSRLWLMLPPTFVLWTNLHGGVLGGLATLGLAIIGWTTAKQLGWNSPFQSWFNAVSSLGLLGVLCLTPFVNPYGPQLPATWFRLMGADLPSMIQEHAPLSLGTLIGRLTLGTAAIYVVILSGLPWRGVRVTWLLPLVWLYLGCTRIRHAPLFSIVALIAMADMLPHTRWAEPLRRRGLLFEHSPLRLTRPIAFALIVPACTLVASAVVHTRSGSELWATPSAAVWPAGVLEQLVPLSRSASGNGRVLNEMQYGGFLIYNTPSTQVFIDDRCELYGEEFLRECFEAYQRPTQLQGWIERYEIRIALTETGSSWDAYLRNHPEWKPVHVGAATLHQKR